jgi:NhaP-type Na+/H+ or K+/H+ antiporter
LSRTTGDTLGVLAQSFLINISGAVIFGIAVAFLLSLWLRRISHDDLLIFSITISSFFLIAYTALFAGLGISMGLSTVVCGLFFCAYCKHYLYAETASSLELLFQILNYLFD